MCLVYKREDSITKKCVINFYFYFCYQSTRDNQIEFISYLLQKKF
jgi:hypothetical protein